MNDRTHGLQFKAAFLRAAPPTTLEGIERYLGSGMIKGIGPVYAKKLVQAFAEDVFDTIEQSPERLREVDGIGPKRAERIRRGWADQKVIREIMLFLHGHGVGTSRAVRIFKTYGQEAIQVISENPYRLARDIRGIGFKSADQIALRLGIEKTAMIRARAGIGYALAEAMDDGHCGLPTDELRHLAAELLEIPPEIVGAALDLELSDGEAVADTVEDRPCVFLAGLYRAEQSIAERLVGLGAGSPPWPAVDPEKAIPWVERKVGISLAESQKEAVRLALRAKVLVITGGPGVGKTTLVNAILKVLQTKTPAIALAAPTGRAAKRMGEPPPGGIGVSFFGFSATIASVVIKRPATDAASCSAVRTTLAGSMTPRATRSPYSLAWASKPQLASVASSSLPTTTAPSRPEFSAICRAGHCNALRTISTPTRWSSLVGFTLSSALIARSSATPPPGTTPSSTAARVACIASSTRSLRSLTSTSVEPPTRILARRIPVRFGLDPTHDLPVLGPMNRGGGLGAAGRARPR